MSLTQWPLITKKLKYLVLLVIKVYVGNFPGKRRKKIAQFLPIETTQPLVAKGQKTVCTKCKKDVHAKCSLNFDFALCSI